MELKRKGEIRAVMKARRKALTSEDQVSQTANYNGRKTSLVYLERDRTKEGA